MGVHAASPLMAEWHRANAEELHLPELHDIDEVVAVFEAAGFHAAAARLAIGFVPTAGHGHHGQGRLLDWLDYYRDQKLLLRLSRTAENRNSLRTTDRDEWRPPRPAGRHEAWEAAPTSGAQGSSWDWAKVRHGVLRSRSQVAIDGATMGDPQREDQELGILDRVDHSVVADADAP